MKPVSFEQGESLSKKIGAKQVCPKNSVNQQNSVNRCQPRENKIRNRTRCR